MRNLSWRLLNLLSRTLVYELGLGRLLGRLEGETPEARYSFFLAQLGRRDYALKLLEEYPVLARLLVTRIEQWAGFGLELVQHLCADWREIRQVFCPGADPGQVVAINGDVGDYHRHGRAVQILQFASGLKLVYKPKALAVDQHFQELLAWLNARGANPALRPLKIVDRGRHGWMEFVPAAGCDTEDQLQRFYERQGAYLALLHLLEATDVHRENLLAAGEHPILFDLESLFQGRPAGIDRSQADRQARGGMERSVLRVGLLPNRLRAEPGGAAVDASGLSGSEGQLSLDARLVFEAAGTGGMRFARKHTPLPASESAHLSGQPANPLDYAAAIEAGFSQMYRLLIDQREGLLAEDGPLAAFAKDEVRAIVSDTRTYAQLLGESYHPALLGSALERDRHFDQLWNGVELLPYLAQVIPAEREDLQRGDVPLFSAYPNSRDIFTSSGRRLADFFEEPAMAAVRRQLQSLSEASLKQQQWFVRAALATLARAREPGTRPAQAVAAVVAVAEREQFVAAARAIGERLVETAWHGPDDASWVGLTVKDDRDYELTSLGLDLYEGLPGLALFLAQLGAMTGEARYTRLAQAALMSVRRQLADEALAPKSVGAFNGWGGIIYAYSHLAALWDEPSLLSEAELFCRRLSPLIEQDENFDVILGSAGSIPPLLALHAQSGAAQALAAAIACGDHLLSRAQRTARGLAWPSKIACLAPLTGFSHGVAGIALALLKLAAATGEERYRAGALAAIDYERSTFSAEAGNWPDLRDYEKLGLPAARGPEHFMTTWCHGAPGIGLARLLCLEHLGPSAGERQPAISEIRVALQTTVRSSFGRNHSLCHGDLGNLELLWHAGLILGDKSALAEGRRIASEVLEAIRLNGWQCGTPLGVESPGLMTGLAGIGYGLLRAADPARVPSVLALAPPARAE